MRKQIETSFVSSAGQKTVSQKTLGAINIPLPPLPEQRRIVAKLDRLSARSAAARDHLAHTTTLAARAKQAILNAEFKKDGCLVQAMRDVAKVLSGFAFKSKDYVAEGIPLIRIGDLDGLNVIINDNTKRLPVQHAEEFERFMLKDGDICVALSGATTGKVGFFRGSHTALLNQRVASIRSLNSGDREYIGWFVSMISDQILAAAYGGAQPNISPKWLEEQKLPWPDENVRLSVVRRIEAAFARLDRLTEEATRAAHLIDRLDERLLAKAFAGELVPQDPNDEPAEALLARIREARSAAPIPTRGRKRKASA